MKINSGDYIRDEELKKKIEEKAEGRVGQFLARLSGRLNLIRETALNTFIKASPCYGSTCRSILIVNAMALIVIILLMTSCAALDLSFCTARSLFGAVAPVILVSVINLAISLLIAIFSSYIEEALMLTLVLSLPLSLIMIISIIGVFLD